MGDTIPQQAPQDPSSNQQQAPQDPSSNQQQAPKPKPPVPQQAEEDQTSDSPWDDPKAAKAEIERLRRENSASRINSKENAANEARAQIIQDLAEVMGITTAEAEKMTPGELAAKLEGTQQEAAQARLELAVYKEAQAQGADAARLLDSRSFLEQIKDLDASDSDAVTAKIKEALTKDPNFRMTQAAVRSGSENPGGTGGAKPTHDSLMGAIGAHYSQ